MKREYSFNEISRITMGVPDHEKKAQPQPYYTTNKSRDSWTDMRVQQIKKKYDTPSHRKNYSHFGNQEKSRQYQNDSFSNNPYTSYRNPLKDSMTSPNVVKKNQKVGTITSNFKDEQQTRNNWQQTQNMPRFSYDSKQNMNFMDKFAQIKNSMKSQSKPSLRDREQTFKPRQSVPSSNTKIDPRVQNIDKINMKIKKILQCLNENQKYPRLQQRVEMKNSFMRGSIISKDNQSQQLEQTKILSRQKISFDKQSSFAHKSNMKNSVMSVQKFAINQKAETSQKFQYKNFQRSNQYQKQNSIKKSFVKVQKQKNVKVQDQTDSWFQPKKNQIDKSRSRSCLGNFINDEIKLNSGKKLDDEITKINARIKQFQEQKKKLNIQFKPYTQLKYNRSTSNLSQHRTHRSIVKPPLPKPAPKYGQATSSYSFIQNKGQKIKTQACQNTKYSYFNNNAKTVQKPDFSIQKQRYSFDVYKNLRTSQQPKPLIRVNSSIKASFIDTLKIQQNRQKSGTPQFEQKQSTCRDDQLQNKKQNQDKYQCNDRSNELKMKTQQGIEQRKRKLLETATVTFSRQTKKLIQNLFQQVKLDEQLRNAKIWFRDQTNPNKWEMLKAQSQKQGFDLTRQRFVISDQQDNPFYSVRDGGQNYHVLVSRWINSQKYWQQNILNQYDLRQFSVQKFTNDKVDLQKKGYFVVQDLVRFLNMETGTFYRNRDLILIFRRLTQNDKLLWKEFLSKLDQQKLN